MFESNMSLGSTIIVQQLYTKTRIDKLHSYNFIWLIAYFSTIFLLWSCVLTTFIKRRLWLWLIEKGVHETFVVIKLRLLTTSALLLTFPAQDVVYCRLALKLKELLGEEIMLTDSRAFSSAVPLPAIWDNLPTSVIEVNSLPVFRRLLKSQDTSVHCCFRKQRLL